MQDCKNKKQLLYCFQFWANGWKQSDIENAVWDNISELKFRFIQVKYSATFYEIKLQLF